MFSGDASGATEAAFKAWSGLPRVDEEALIVIAGATVIAAELLK